MVTAVASRPSVNTPPAINREVVGFATCPSCHTEDPTMLNVAVGAGADWHCGRCGQRWDAVPPGDRRRLRRVGLRANGLV
jgi:hypothetical protein